MRLYLIYHCQARQSRDAGTYIEAIGFEQENVQVVVRTYAHDSSKIVGESSLYLLLLYAFHHFMS